MNYTKLQSNNDKTTRIAWRFSLAHQPVFGPKPRIMQKQCN